MAMESFNHATLESVLAARHLTLKSVSERTGVPESNLREQLEREAGPDAATLKLLSRQLSVPDFVFFMDRPPEFTASLVDFRLARPAVVPKSPSTIATIALAQRIREVAGQLGHNDFFSKSLKATIKATDKAQFSSELSAKKFRTILGITSELQFNSQNPAKFFATCRAKVEATGIFVIQDSFPSEDGSGFCLADYQPGLIVLNTHNQNHARRNFTLFHELAHLLIGRTGISDPFETRNLVERQCNLFSARLLCPESLAEEVQRRIRPSRQPTTEEVYRCAKLLNISQEATVLRFEQLNIFEVGSYSAWKRAVSDNNPDWLNKGGGGNVPQEKIKFSRYGSTFASVFGKAIRRKSLSPLQLYRISGLKPKYQKSYFEYAASADAVGSDEI